MAVHSDTLLAQFRANLDQYKELSRNMVYEVAKASFDYFFTHTLPQLAVAPTVQPTVAVTGGSKSKGASGGIPEQWSRIISSKEYGVCAYPEFKTVHEQMKKERTGLNYFTAVSEIRTRFEGTPHWQGYIEWVRAKHPNKVALAKDPSPRKSKNTVSSTVPVSTAPLSMPKIPGAVPGIASMPMPGAVPSTVPMTMTMSGAVPSTVPMPILGTVPGMPSIVPMSVAPTIPHAVAQYNSGDDEEVEEHSD